ncbi:MAG: DEAD/DEAH box helicase [Bacteroidia bacterium]|nr:DEAD/DEAH box helicase [Bacteroidia bacterium]
MNILDLHRRITDQYLKYLNSFVYVQDKRIASKLEEMRHTKPFMPEPLVQFNPSFELGDTSKESLVQKLGLHPHMQRILDPFRLYRHQEEAIRLGVNGQGYILTSGTGSGKSLTYMASIFNHVLKRPEAGKGVKAIVVYPMNALINSQHEEIERKFKEKLEADFPISFAKYTGQQSQTERDQVREQQHDILLTNYMMLELIMTRATESWLRESMQKHLQYLVFDELHTYRGRQGADVSLLIRRIQELVGRPLTLIGTSATMASEGTQESRKQLIAQTAEMLFGTPFEEDQIVGEYLTPSTHPFEADEQADWEAVLHAQLPDTYEALAVHPLVRWLEHRIALRRQQSGEWERGKPMTVPEIADRLVQDTGQPGTDCSAKIRELLACLDRINARHHEQGIRLRLLPFRLHQFISQAGEVRVSLDEPAFRHIEIGNQKYWKDAERNQDSPLFPVRFSRHSGAAFVCVEKDFENEVLRPSDPDYAVQEDDEETEESVPGRGKYHETTYPSGYLIFQDKTDEPLWSEDLIELFPQSWWRESGGKLVLETAYRYRIPHQIWFDQAGNYATQPKAGLPLSGWFVPAPMIFDPTAGVVYEMRSKETAKLASLNSEGRSTATSLLSFAVLSGLVEEGEVGKTCKLLSFTDNRQDASLQAGHFNDFVAAAHLRSAINQAIVSASPNGLRSYEVAEKVFAHLDLPERTYAVNPSGAIPDAANSRALKLLLQYRMLRDLRNSWRYSLPNLEQTGLLRIRYEHLATLCNDTAYIAHIPLLVRMSSSERVILLEALLDYIRTSFALTHPLLEQEAAQAENLMREKLREDSYWSLDREERIETGAYAVVQSMGKVKGMKTASLSTRSYWGRYLKRRHREVLEIELENRELPGLVEELCDLLCSWNLLRADTLKGEKGEFKGYRLRADQLIWQRNEQESAWWDRVRLRAGEMYRPRINPFFQQLYLENFGRFQKNLLAREHTGQQSNDDRQSRENDFRQGEISALYCSPTMELGIDISELNIVHMRNVPPSPANYVQRSGRAGRSGQAALVFTYCHGLSPHDQYYFERRIEMVAGVVRPPYLDLEQEELIRTHLHAFLLMHTGLRELKDSVADVLNLNHGPAYPLKLELREKLEHFAAKDGTAAAAAFFKEIAQRLGGGAQPGWLSQEWVKRQVVQMPEIFDRAFDRWRVLFRANEKRLAEAQRTINDHTYKPDSDLKKQARDQRRNGERQRDILLNQGGGSASGESDFYLFRYLAAEGFLPGYNFTRLPVRAWLGARARGEGHFVSRPRFLGLREFGPGNMIYHNGRRYRITGLALADATLPLRSMVAARATGYAHWDSEVQTHTNDPITGEALINGTNSAEAFSNLIQLLDSETVAISRITSEEEERTRQGYVIDTFFNYTGGMDSTQQAVLKWEGKELLRLIFGPATRLIHLNRRWRRSPRSHGFHLNRNNGFWMRQKDLETAPADAVRVVIPYIDHTADTLYVQPLEALGLDNEQVHSLAFALKRAIEAQYLLEEQEILVDTLGSGDTPNILLIEGTEGSMGILGQLVTQPNRLRQVIIKAYELLHFDPETHTDRRPELPKATYQDLLSYYNQPWHKIMDRHSIQEALKVLMACDLQRLTSGRDRDAHYHYLRERTHPDSDMERKFLDFLYRHGYRLPDQTQVNLKDCYASADFWYEAGRVAIFCDGSVHDYPNVVREDDAKRRCLEDHGCDVIVWYYRQPLAELVKGRGDVFGEGVRGY